MTALIIEDSPVMAEAVRRVLESEGFSCTIASDGAEGLRQALGTSQELVILDLRLPLHDGLEICQQMRALGLQTPVLILTGRGGTTDVVRGLEAGADDYLAKPFAVEELRARIRALMRRARSGVPDDLVEVGDLCLDLGRRQAARAGAPVELTRREFELLEALMTSAGRVLSRRRLLREVWQDDRSSNTKIVDVYVRYLRRKIDEPFGCDSIEAVRGVGYRFRDAGTG